jgi:hypothetical protein
MRAAAVPQTEFDPRARRLARPHEGFWLLRVGQGYPWAPARIVMLQTQHEPGVPDNDMRGTRSSHLAAFISGLPVKMADVWERRGRVITRAEYDKAMAAITAARRADRYLPAAVPFQKVSLPHVRIPFT